jgi:hypothetical protein
MCDLSFCLDSKPVSVTDLLGSVFRCSCETEALSFSKRKTIQSFVLSSVHPLTTNHHRNHHNIHAGNLLVDVCVGHRNNEEEKAKVTIQQYFGDGVERGGGGQDLDPTTRDNSYHTKSQKIYLCTAQERAAKCLTLGRGRRRYSTTSVRDLQLGTAVPFTVHWPSACATRWWLTLRL